MMLSEERPCGREPDVQVKSSHPEADSTEDESPSPPPQKKKRVVEESQFAFTAPPVGKLLVTSSPTISVTATPAKKDRRVVSDTPTTAQSRYDALFPDLPAVKLPDFTSFPVSRGDHNFNTASPSRSPQLFSTAHENLQEPALDVMDAMEGVITDTPGVHGDEVDPAIDFDSTAVNGIAANGLAVDFEPSQFEPQRGSSAVPMHSDDDAISHTADLALLPPKGSADQDASAPAKDSSKQSTSVTGNNATNGATVITASDKLKANGASTTDHSSHDQSENQEPTDDEDENEPVSAPIRTQSGSAAPKSTPHGFTAVNDPSTGADPAAGSTAPATGESKRGRGRPRKTPQATPSKPVPTQADTTIKRGPGRPRKSNISLGAPAPSSELGGDPPATNRGRKRKASPSPASTATRSSKRVKTDTTKAASNKANTPKTRTSASASAAAPPSKPSKPISKDTPYRLAFSNSSIPDRSAILKFFKIEGGTVVSTPKKGNYDALLVGPGQLVKSYKLLTTVALGLPVICDAWLRDSALASQLLDHKDYKPVAKATDKKQVERGLLSSTNSSPRTKLLHGKTLYVTPALKREYGRDFANIETLTKLLGGNIISKSHRGVDIKHTHIILGSEKNTDPDAVYMLDEGHDVYNRDFLSYVILRGELDFNASEYKMEVPPKKTSPAKANKVVKPKGKKPTITTAGAAAKPSATKRGRGRPKKGSR